MSCLCLDWTRNYHSVKRLVFVLKPESEVLDFLKQSAAGVSSWLQQLWAGSTAGAACCCSGPDTPGKRADTAGGSSRPEQGAHCYKLQTHCVYIYTSHCEQNIYCSRFSAGGFSSCVWPTSLSWPGIKRAAVVAGEEPALTIGRPYSPAWWDGGREERRYGGGDKAKPSSTDHSPLRWPP